MLLLSESCPWWFYNWVNEQPPASCRPRQDCLFIAACSILPLFPGNSREWIGQNSLSRLRLRRSVQQLCLRARVWQRTPDLTDRSLGEGETSQDASRWQAGQ